MANFKSTWLFRTNFQDYGWSESWYFTASDKMGAHQQSIVCARVRMMSVANTCTLVAVRTTANIPPFTPDVMLQRDMLITFQNIPG
jgi:hypothetical protein